MKKMFFVLTVLLSISVISCRTMKTQKQKEKDLNDIYTMLKTRLPGDVTYVDGKIKIVLGELVYFKVGSADINQSSSKNLDILADILNKYSQTLIDLNGYTDNTGSKNVNDKLSLDRANSVKSYLESQGVKEKRMHAKGFAEQFPVASNETDEGRQLNRRVEFLIYY